MDNIIQVYWLENMITDSTRFENNTSSVLCPILVIDSVTVLEANTIPVDRIISDHDPTYSRRLWLLKLDVLSNDSLVI